jgi:hypothetical protein
LLTVLFSIRPSVQYCPASSLYLRLFLAFKTKVNAKVRAFKLIYCFTSPVHHDDDSLLVGLDLHCHG